MSITSSNYQIILDAKINTATLNAQINGANSTVKKLSFDATGNSASTSAKQVNTLWTSLNKLNSTIAVVRGLTNVVGDLTDAVFTLNKATIEYQKVSDLVGDDMDAFIEKAGRAGEELGRTASQMVEASSEFKKSGFDDNDALVLAEVSQMFSNVADSELSASDSAGILISNMKAFNITAEDSMHIIDSINEVSNSFSVSSTDISSGLKKTASAMAVLGNNFEQSIGLVTAG